MPELTALHFGLFGLMVVVGIIVGWSLRADRCAKEKIAVSAGWQNQLESQQSEHDRLAEQNKSLMEQVSQYQASQKDYSNRARELSDSLKEAFERRDELQRQIKEIRGNLDVAAAQRDRLQGNLNSQNVQGQTSALKDKDDKIFRLSRELTSWQSRVPPLVEKFQERDRKARELEDELEKVQTRMLALEDIVNSDQTRIEPVDADSLPDGGDASNEPMALTSAHDTSGLQDQINDDSDLDEIFDSASGGGSSTEVSVDDGTFADVFGMPGDIAEDPAHDDQSAALAENDDDNAQGEFASEDYESADDDKDSEIYDGNEDFESCDSDARGNDDLRKIKGIGPAIEKILNDLGFCRFNQIAEMSEFDIDRVAQQLKGFRSRVYREDWIGQAREFQSQKNNDSS